VATVQVAGPYNWVAGYNPLMPGDSLMWALGPFGGVVYSVTAIPGNTRGYFPISVEVAGLSTALGADYGQYVNFSTTNVASNGVWSMRVFVAINDL
jgi:hypothetical protein